MKFTLSWLKTHLDTSAGLETITARLTALGLEVENVIDPAAALQGFVVGEILAAEQHPNADRLRVCRVAIGSGEVSLVCGAPNAIQGLKSVFAPPGSRIPRTGAILTPATIRGVASNGMLCSGYELMLSEEHDGIIALDPAAKPGAPAAVWLGQDDPVIEIAITPNRADALGVSGIARDLAAAGIGTLIAQNAEPVPAAFATPNKIMLAPGAAAACPFYALRMIRGVKNGPSPAWLQQCLTAIGLKPISFLVDVTNFITYDRNRPLHVFDAAKLNGDLVLRFAEDGESLAALNGKTYPLEPSMVVIADENGAQSLGGIIGGAATGVDDNTTDILIEAALFDPTRTAATGRKLTINSDARYRFERGIDPAGTLSGLQIATRLILENGGGTAGSVVSAGMHPPSSTAIEFRPRRVASLGGLDVAAADSRRILAALGFVVDASSDDTWSVQAPSWRGDIQGEADLVEEILRVIGYDSIAPLPLPRGDGLPEPSITPAARRQEQLRRVLAASGLDEAITFAFVSQATAKRFGGGEPDLALRNPIAAELDWLRPTPLPNLILAAGRNLARGEAEVRLFEIGAGYHAPGENGQTTIAAGLRAGPATERDWAIKARDVNFYDVKADVEQALSEIGFAPDYLKLSADAADWYHPGQSARLSQGDQTIAQFGMIHPAILKEMEIKAPVAGFEIFVDALDFVDARQARPAFTPSPLQPLRRDFAFIVATQIQAETLLAAVREADPLIEKVALFDVYTSGDRAGDEKSLAIAVTLQPHDHTLTDSEIEAVSARIIAAALAATGGKLRS